MWFKWTVGVKTPLNVPQLLREAADFVNFFCFEFIQAIAFIKNVPVVLTDDMKVIIVDTADYRDQSYVEIYVAATNGVWKWKTVKRQRLLVIKINNRNK